MALSFGGSSSSSRTRSQSLSESSSDRLGLNFQRSQQGSFIAPGQAPYLNALYAQGAGLANQLGGIGQQGQELGAQLGGIGMEQLGNLGGIAGGQNPFMQNLLARASGVNPYINQQIAGFGQDIAQNLRQNILPQIGSGFGLANQYGGGRQGLAEGMALQEAQQQFARGAADLRSDAYSQGLGAAGTALQAQAGAAQGALGALPGQFDLGMAGPLAGFLPLQQLQGLLGSPTVLSRGSSVGGGLDLATARSRAESTSTGRSKSGGFSFGL